MFRFPVADARPQFGDLEVLLLSPLLIFSPRPEPQSGSVLLRLPQAQRHHVFTCASAFADAVSETAKQMDQPEPLELLFDLGAGQPVSSVVWHPENASSIVAVGDGKVTIPLTVSPNFSLVPI